MSNQSKYIKNRILLESFADGHQHTQNTKEKTNEDGHAELVSASVITSRNLIKTLILQTDPLMFVNEFNIDTLSLDSN